MNEEKKKSKLSLFIIAFFMTLSMFTRIPSIVRKWEEDAKKYMIVWLPFIGGIIGGLWMLLYYAFSLIELPFLIESFVLTIFPFLLTGFIHFDGFLDVTDALHSYRPIDEKIRILKDPHIGGFAVLYGITVFLGYFVGIGSIGNNAMFFLLFVPVISRISSGLALSFFKKIKVSEYYQEEINKKENNIKIIYFLVFYIGIIILSYFLIGIMFISLVVIPVFHLILCLICNKSFKGINGDVTGYALVLSEMLSIILYAIMGALLWY